MGLCCLASRNAYRTVASTFGIGKSTSVQITNSCIDALNELYDDWIKFPESVPETGEAIPQIQGVVDESHIPMKAPEHNKESYFNRKHFYSMNLVTHGHCR